MPRRKHQLDTSRIDLLRVRKGWALDDFARRAGVSEGTVSNVMRGEGVLVSTAKKLADALGVEVREIVAEPEQVPPPPQEDNFPKVNGGYREVSFWVGQRGPDGALRLFEFERFDETTDLPRFLDRLNRVIAEAGVQLDWARVSRFELPPDDGKAHRFQHQLHLREYEGCAVVTATLPYDAYEFFHGTDDDDDNEDEVDDNKTPISKLIDAYVM